MRGIDDSSALGLALNLGGLALFSLPAVFGGAGVMYLATGEVGWHNAVGSVIAVWMFHQWAGKRA
jgi:hypothetical protein